MNRHTQYPCTVFVFSIAALAYALMAGSAHATTRTKANNTTNLNLTGSWSGGVVPGSGDIALWDATVTAANTVSLGTDLNFGEIQITNPGGNVTINAGNTLTLSGVSGVGIDMSSATQNLLLNCAITLGAAQTWNVAAGRFLSVGGSALNNGGNLLTINAASSSSVSLGTVISGAGGVSYGGGGSVSVSGGNTYTGVTTIGVVQLFVTTLANVNTASSIGKGSVGGSASDWVFGTGAASAPILSYIGSTAASTDRLFTIAPNATAQIDNQSSNAANTLSFTATGSIAFTGSGSRTLNLTGSNTGNNTFAPIIGDGAGGGTQLSKLGPGSWTITGANTYTGGTQVLNGTLTVSGSGTLGASTGSLSVSSFFNTPVILNLNVDQTVGSLQGSISGTGTATINIASGKTLTSNQSVNTTYAGVIAGAGAFTKSGSGTLTLSGTNTYSGITKIDGGILSVGSLANINTASGIGTGSVAGSSADLVFGGGTLQYSGTTGATSTNRLFTIGDTAGLTVTLDSSSATAANTMSFTSTGSIAFGGSGARTLTLTGSNTGNNAFAPSIGDGTGGATSLIKSGAGTWVLSGANTYTGGTTINAGTLQAGSTTALGPAANATLTFGSGSTGKFQLFGFNTTVIDLNTNATAGTPIIESGSGTAGTDTLTVNNSNNDVYAGVLQNGSTRLLGLTKSGTGTLTFTGANTYTAVTRVNAGELDLNTAAGMNAIAGDLIIGDGVGAANTATVKLLAANQIKNGNIFIVTINSDGVLNLNNNAETIDALSSSSSTSSVTLGTGTLTVGSSNIAAAGFAGVISGTGGSLVKIGSSGAQTLSGANTYTGTTTINAGTLYLDNNNTTTARLANTSSITVNSGGTLGLLQSGVASNDRINNNATMTLNGGTFNTGGLQEHGATNNTAGIGALTLQSSSVIDMASGTSILAFANSSANSVAWGTGKSLDIWDWTGTPLTGGGTDQLYFGSDATGLTASQLLEIHFYSGAGTGLYGGPTLILLDGEVVPVPEPSTWVAAGLAFVALAFTQRRRLSHLGTRD
jgi:fibronectin-binding autotransporter adhesin